MDKNKEVLKHCPHFYTIINFEYYSDDIVSEKLIDIYEKYIFNVDITEIDNVNKIEKLDSILFQYINDYCFREQIKQDIMKVKVQRGENLLDSIVSTIINLWSDYEKVRTRRVQMTRWI
jgi:hypothetical protein